ncbi:MAG: V-type ATP synthase subunit D [Elusimicrobia bacterium]|nr:V-type ATP synthase subunit D [Elusimicrobiota bacterium]
MRLNINPNRMELLKVRRRLILARRGHKLLKDKQDELVRQFILLIKKTSDLRDEVEKKLSVLYKNYIMTKAVQSKVITDYLISSSAQKVEIKRHQKIFMNIPLVEFSLNFSQPDEQYNFFNASSKMDFVISGAKELLPQIINLSQSEFQLQLLALEIERTRRRVNALEYIFIPSLIETTKYITMKMSELERDSITRLMRVKEIVRSH